MTYMAGRNYPIENIIQDTSARAWNNKNFVQGDLLKSCMVVPRSVTLESINWLLKQKLIPGNHHAQSSLRQIGLGWGGRHFQYMSDATEDTYYEVSAYSRGSD